MAGRVASMDRVKQVLWLVAALAAVVVAVLLIASGCQAKQDQEAPRDDIDRILDDLRNP